MHSIHYEHILCISWISCVFHICQLLVNPFYKISIHFFLSLFIFRNYLKLNYIVLKFPTLIVGLCISQFCQLFMNFEALILSTCKFRLFFFKKLMYLNWRLITLQCCSVFGHTWFSYGWTCVPHPEPLSPSHPSGLSQCTGSEHPVSCIELRLVIHFSMVIYMFQCYSLKSSHPRLLPESKSLFFMSVSLLLSCI